MDFDGTVLEATKNLFFALLGAAVVFLMYERQLRALQDRLLRLETIVDYQQNNRYYQNHTIFYHQEALQPQDNENELRQRVTHEQA